MSEKNIVNESVVRVTDGSGHYFFGYYDKSPWDTSGRWILGMRVGFMGHAPDGTEVAEVGLIDTESEYAWRPFAETRAWNWQQGCMLQWLGGHGAGEVIFNDREGDQFVARIVNPWTGQSRTLSRPVYAVDPLGRHAVSVNFSRLHHQRPGYGYAGVEDRWKKDAEPQDDGLYFLDLSSGESRLILSIAQAAAYQRKSEFDQKIHRFNHIQFNRSGDRFAFLHRYQTGPGSGHRTRLMELGVQGEGLRCVSDHDMISHYDWNHRGEILAWARRHGVGDHYYLFSGDGEPEVIGESLFEDDGHCSFSPDDQWMLTDSYPDERSHRSLMLYHFKDRRRVDLGSFYSMPLLDEIRCDLHPRWSRDGKRICFDSTHEGSRQMYVLDLKDIV